MEGWRATSGLVNFTILDETAELLVVNKPAGVLIHPTKPGGPRTLWDGARDLLAYELVNGGQVSIINRLDRETSGLVLLAKSSVAAREAAMAMAAGGIRKAYLAVVFGWPEWERVTVDAPILRLGEVGESRIWLKRGVHPAGAVARTDIEVLSRWARRSDGARFAVVRAAPVTGRTHQIRVHLAHAGNPVIGDKIYGPDEGWYLRFIAEGWGAEMAEALWLDRQALHSAALELDWRGGRRRWEAPVPGDFKALFDSADESA